MAKSESSEKAVLSNVEVEIIDLFVGFAQVFNIPKSVGAIFGVLFASEKPLSFDEIVEKLKISKGSASQGLKFLRSVNAVKTIYVPGERKDYFVAADQLRPLIVGFLRDRFDPHLKNGTHKINTIEALVEEGDVSEVLQKRVARLKQWSQRIEKMIPWTMKLLEK